MQVIGSDLRTAERNFLDNQARMETLVRDLKERLSRVRAGGGQQGRERPGDAHHPLSGRMQRSVSMSDHKTASASGRTARVSRTHIGTVWPCTMKLSPIGRNRSDGILDNYGTHRVCLLEPTLYGT